MTADVEHCIYCDDINHEEDTCANLKCDEGSKVSRGDVDTGSIYIPVTIGYKQKVRGDTLYSIVYQFAVKRSGASVPNCMLKRGTA